jgi:hypothetical protein
VIREGYDAVHVLRRIVAVTDAHSHGCILWANDNTLCAARHVVLAGGPDTSRPSGVRRTGIRDSGFGIRGWKGSDGWRGRARSFQRPAVSVQVSTPHLRPSTVDCLRAQGSQRQESEVGNRVPGLSKSGAPWFGIDVHAHFRLSLSIDTNGGVR